MKCITNGEVVRRVSDKEAEHYINREGWEYCQKKVQKDGFVCAVCGKKYLHKPETCSGFIISHKKGKDGLDVAEKHHCKSKKFVPAKILVRTWL